jgi:hypothetical protein
MEAYFSHHGCAGRYYTVTPDGGAPFMVLVREDLLGNFTFEFLGLRPLSLRVPAMIAVLTTMNVAAAA